MADIFACDNEVRAAFVDAAQHDMAVRVASVEVVDRDPVEPCLEVLFNLLHQSAHKGLQIIVLIGILCGYDEAELMPVLLAPFEEGIAIGAIGLRTVQFTGLTFAGHTIALNVVEMSPRCVQGPTAHAH